MKLFSERSTNLIKLYSWNNIFFKYFSKSVIYILMPLTVLSMIVCFFIFKSVEDDIISERSRSFYQTASVLETILNDVENNHLVMSSSSDVITYAYIDNDTDFDTEYSAMYNSRKLMKNICISSQYIKNIHLYQPLKDYVFSTLSGNDLDTFYLKEWYRIFSETGISDFVYFNKSDQPAVYPDSVIFVKPLISNDTLRGIVLYDINAQSFRDVFKQNGYDHNISILCDVNGKVFYSDNSELIGKNINTISSSVDLNSIHGLKEKAGILYLSDQINHSYKYVASYTVSNNKTYLQMLGIVAIIVLTALLLSFILSFYLSLQFYQSIIKITATLRNEEENGEENLAREKYEELYYINSHIVSRLTKTSDVEKRLAEQITDLKKAQFVALQTQLNPHFIYNTLNLINVMVIKMAKGESDASRAIVILSQLLREALDTKKYLIALGDELEYAKKYVELQKLKFKYNIDIVWDIDENLLEKKVLKFMLQPIVENAFEHGFNQMSRDEYKLIISAHRIESNIILSVTNNGKEIEPEVLGDLQNTLNSDAIFDHKGIGLVNVNHRIRLIYGAPYGCSIESKNGITSIKIVLPGESESITEFNSR